MNNTPTPRTDAQINGKPCTPLEREQALQSLTTNAPTSEKI